MRDRLYIEKKHRELYEKLDQEEILRFTGGRRNRLEQFLFTVALGYKNECRKSLSSREGFILLKDVPSDVRALLSAVAIASSDSIEVVADEDRLYTIIEEYASGGFEILMDRLDQPLGTFEKELEKELVDLHHKLGIGNDEGQKNITY
ncbi:MAG: hypothetical protein AB1330_09175 [Bacillota bacterium]